ncbi:transmembrane channel-like protein 7 [Salarias fasciatus]|uniref:Transmembrane channel-like protein n=1 Tax=Salarias fasciatus TaxID=181472 RepID=A0A672HSD9_SALFA|nr:transmembrane channel-like protein 4 [Salarias fasciatus]
MDGGLQREDPGASYFRESLRLRRRPSRVSNQLNRDSSSDEDEEEDEVDGEDQARELRNTPFSMALKKAVRQAQLMKMPVVSSSNSWKMKRSKILRQLKSSARDVVGYLTLWDKTLQKIGGNFGGGVQSYFLFLRFLVVLNFLSFLLLAAFVIIPSIIFSRVGTSFSNTSETLNLCADCAAECMEYEPNPQGLRMFYSYFLDLLSGTHFMEYTYLFYGYYSNTVLEDRNFSYNIPLAYLLTAVFYLAFCLVCIIARMGTAARVAVVTGGSTVGNYSMIVFCGWDYGCLGDRATKLKQRNVLYRLQVDLEEEALKRRAAARTLKQRVLLYSLRVAMFFVALGLIIAAFVGIFEATNFSQENRQEEGFLSLLLEYLPSIVITAGNFVVPMLCDQIALIERYTPSTTVILALLRAVFLRLMSLAILLITLWQQITCEGDTESQNCKLCLYNHVDYPCWETRLGQEMYKLTLFDFLVSVAVLVLVEFPRRMVVDNWSNKLVQWFGRQQFTVPANVLELVYGQTVVWTGALFCPLLPLISVVKFVLFFYFKKINLFNNCRPALRTFRSTTSTVFFLMVLLIGWCLAAAVVIYSIAEIHPSISCGPFRVSSNIWSIVPSSILNLSEVTQEFLFFIGSQAFAIPLCVLSCVVMCYVIVLAAAYGKSVSLLRKRLKMEGRDKQFLVKQIGELTRKLQIPNSE